MTDTPILAAMKNTRAEKVLQGKEKITEKRLAGGKACDSVTSSGAG